jgi:hypothetical protein
VGRLLTTWEVALSRPTRQFGRGPWIPKRLVEAWAGATLKEAIPEASFWASTYRAQDGIGAWPGRGLLLLQCSPAEDRARGISTRVSRTMLATYLEDPNLASWADRALFVLVGERGLDSYAEAPSLWTVAAADLCRVVDGQGRGTINAHTLASLIGAGVAVELSTRVQTLGLRDGVERVNFRPASTGGHSWGYYSFGFNRPTPLGVATDGHAEVAFVS